MRCWQVCGLTLTETCSQICALICALTWETAVQGHQEGQEQVESPPEEGQYVSPIPQAGLSQPRQNPQAVSGRTKLPGQNPSQAPRPSQEGSEGCRQAGTSLLA